MTTRVVLGTGNPGKVAEMAALLSPLGIELGTLALDVPEPAPTFEGNARIKGLAYAAQTGGALTVCEDSGLCIPALGGLPGPWSARFADCDIEGGRIVRVVESGRERAEIDLANNERVLSLLSGVEMPRRAAAFVVRVVVAQGDRIVYEDGAEAHGWIAESPRGDRGFGYDPIFVGADTFGSTYAELDAHRKNTRSHRKQVMARLAHWLAAQVRP